MMHCEIKDEQLRRKQKILPNITVNVCGYMCSSILR